MSFNTWIADFIALPFKSSYFLKLVLIMQSFNLLGIFKFNCMRNAFNYVFASFCNPRLPYIFLYKVIRLFYIIQQLLCSI